MILERVIRIPLHQYARFFEKLIHRLLVNIRYTQISKLRPLEELITEQQIEEFGVSVRGVANKQLESGEYVKKTDSDYTEDIRTMIHEIKSETYHATQKMVHARWPFESLIKRGYFHVKPLDDLQLENWRKVIL